MQRNDNHRAVQRADEARQVLTNPAYIEAMGMLRESILAEWQNCPIRDTEGQRLLLQLVKLHAKFESALRALVEAGKLAQHAIDIDDERDESGARKLMRRVL